jgi:hypothetical protein
MTTKYCTETPGINFRLLVHYFRKAEKVNSRIPKERRHAGESGAAGAHLRR